MQITKDTKYAQFVDAERFITEATKQELKEAAQKAFGEYWALTVAQFVAIAGGDVSMLGDVESPTVLQVYWLLGFKDFVQDFSRIMQGLQVPKDAQEMTAEEVTKKTTMAESMVVFLRSYFGLQSFEDAERKTLTDYVVARRDIYNQVAYNKRLAGLRAKQYNKK